MTTYEYRFRIMRDDFLVYADHPYSSEPFAREAAAGYLGWRKNHSANPALMDIEIDRRIVHPTPEWEPVPHPDIDGGTGCRVCEEDQHLEGVLRSDHDCKFFR